MAKLNIVELNPERIYQTSDRSQDVNSANQVILAISAQLSKNIDVVKEGIDRGREILKNIKDQAIANESLKSQEKMMSLSELKLILARIYILYLEFLERYNKILKGDLIGNIFFFQNGLNSYISNIVYENDLSGKERTEIDTLDGVAENVKRYTKNNGLEKSDLHTISDKVNMVTLGSLLLFSAYNDAKIAQDNNKYSEKTHCIRK